MPDYYSTLKAAWHLDRIQMMRLGIQPSPVELQFIISDLCNQDCHFCAYRSSIGLSSEGFAGPNGEKNPNRMIPTDKAIEILRDFSAMDGKSVIFTGGGEPTIHPDHLGLFQDALMLGLDCSLNTNGMLLRDGWESILPKFKYIRVSVDAGTPDEYAKIRRAKPSDYEKALSNIKKMVDACKETGCVVGAGYVVTPDNWKNLDKGLLNLAETGVAYTRLASMQSTLGQNAYPDVTWDAAKWSVQDQVRVEYPNGMKVVDLFEPAMGKKMDSPLCGMQHFVLYVGADLNAYRCCYTAYTDLGRSGSLSDKRLIDWWSSMEKEESYRNFDARSCQVCPLYDKNQVISYMASDNPTHVNFV